MKENIDIFKACCRIIEQDFSCKLSMHDYTGMLAHGELLPMHLYSPCIEFKKAHRQRDSECINFDYLQAPLKAQELGRGFFKRCSAGVLEAVFPVFSGKTLSGLIFAGPFAAGEAELTAPVKDKLPELDLKLPALTSAQKEKLLVHGEMLASYLGNCCTPRFGNDRKDIVLDYLLHNAHLPDAGLDQLAERMNLTPARACQYIKKTFNRTFSQLLTQERLRIARQYLNATNFPVQYIALKSGFRDGAYFHRIFKRVYNITPAAYRQSRASRTTTEE